MDNTKKAHDIAIKVLEACARKTGFYASGLWFAGSGGPVRPGFVQPNTTAQQATQRETRACTGPITYTGQEAVKSDIANLKAAIAGKDVEGYVAALGPLSIGAGIRNEHYASEEEYMMAQDQYGQSSQNQTAHSPAWIDHHSPPLLSGIQLTVMGEKLRLQS